MCSPSIQWLQEWSQDGSSLALTRLGPAPTNLVLRVASWIRRRFGSQCICHKWILRSRSVVSARILGLSESKRLWEDTPWHSHLHLYIYIYINMMINIYLCIYTQAYHYLSTREIQFLLPGGGRGWRSRPSHVKQIQLAMPMGYYVSMVVNESTYCLHIYIYIHFYIYSGGCSCGILRFFSANWSVNVPQGGAPLDHQGQGI